METLNRREVLVSAAMLLGNPGAVVGANDRIGIASIGLGGRGGLLMMEAAGIPGVEVVSVCDPDETRMQKYASELEAKTGKKPNMEPDVRRVLEDKSVDAINIATCNHWHAPAAIWACQAGKHVYVEKPVSHNVWEGRKLVEAARKYHRCVQGGTQWYSNPMYRNAVRLLQDGAIGNLYMARAVLCGARDSIGFKSPEDPPSSLHWDLWLGPAPDQPFHRNLVHYNWHWFWDTGNGEMGNNGSHSLNLARWALNKGLPRRIHSAGGRFGYKDQAQTPNTQTTTFEYDDGTLLVSEIRGLYTGEVRNSWTWHFYGTEGYMYVESGKGYEIYVGRKKTPEPPRDGAEPVRKGDDGTRAHYRNFIEAIRADKPDLLAGEIEKLHLSCSLCHLGNISYRLHRTVQFDAETERFVGDAEADRLLRREYRRPFVVSEKV